MIKINIKLLLPILLFFSMSNCTLNDDIESIEKNEHKVGMWVLMLWFDDKDQSYFPWDSYVRYTPTYKNRYNSYDDEFIDYTLLKSEELGINYLILDNTNGVFRHNGNFDVVIAKYLSRIKKLKLKIKISIAIGWSIYQMNNFDLLERSIEHLSNNYFDDPSYYTIDNEPLIIFYINPNNRLHLMEGFNAAPNNNKDDVYGFKSYFDHLQVRYASGADSWLKDPDGIYGWKFDYPQHKNLNSMGVMPGWDRSHNSLTGSTPVNRESGAFYIKSWNNVLSICPDNVVITSWDDWAEETFIADSYEFNSLYFDITKEKIKDFKNCWKNK